MRDSLSEAKRVLYHEILITPVEQLSDLDANIGFLLAQDPYIQALLDRAMPTTSPGEKPL